MDKSKYIESLLESGEIDGDVANQIENWEDVGDSIDTIYDRLVEEGDIVSMDQEAV